MSNQTTVPKKRIFNYNGKQLEDPDPTMTPQQVLEFHTLLNAELTNSELKGPVVGSDGVESYNLEVKIGTDG